MSVSPKINPCIKGQLIFSKCAKTIQWEKSSLFSKWSYNNGPSICKRMNLCLSLPPQVNINSKAIKYLSVTANTIKVLEGYISKHLPDVCLGWGNGFFPPPPPTPHSRNTVVDLKSSCFIGSEDLFGSQRILTLVSLELQMPACKCSYWGSWMFARLLGWCTHVNSVHCHSQNPDQSIPSLGS